MRLQVLDPELYSGDDLTQGEHPLDAGLDLRSRVAFDSPGERVHKIPLGVGVELPMDSYGMIGSRSSTLLKWGLLTQEGKVDAGYRGEIHLIAYATRRTRVERGDRIAQLIVVSIHAPRFEVVDDLDSGDRGDAGFGSTGAT